jgi:hypothetical protein
MTEFTPAVLVVAVVSLAPAGATESEYEQVFTDGRTCNSSVKMSNRDHRIKI